MSDSAPRRRLRFSLITLIVAVNVAGVLVCANVRYSGPVLVQVSGEPSDGVSFDYWWGAYRGWPSHYEEDGPYQVYPEVHERVRASTGRSTFVLPMRGQREIAFEELEWVGWHIPFSSHFGSGANEDEFRARVDTNRYPAIWNSTGLLCNLAIAAVLVLSSSLLTEFLARKFRKAKRHNE